jgi:hypothetical protein
MTDDTAQTAAIAHLSQRIRELEARRQEEHDPAMRASLGRELFDLKALQLRLWRQREGR